MKMFILIIWLNKLVEFKSPDKCSIFMLHIVRENFDRKVPHSIFPIVLLELALDHNVKLPKEKFIEKRAHDILILRVISHIFEFLGTHSHY